MRSKSRFISSLFDLARMELKDVVDKVENCEAFKAFRHQHPEAFLAHSLVLFDGPSQQWHLGYFDQSKESMMTFIMCDGVIDAVEDKEILRTAHAIMALDAASVKLSSEDALKVARDVAAQHYPHEQIVKTFFVVQVIESQPVFNITFFTRAFSTINVHLSTTDGTVGTHSCERLFDYA